jgi:hypothetical protein
VKVFITGGNGFAGTALTRVPLCEKHEAVREVITRFGVVLGRPSFLRAPRFMIKLVLGELGSVILEGQKVVPGKLLETGFSFRFPNLRPALESLVK